MSKVSSCYGYGGSLGLTLRNVSGAALEVRLVMSAPDSSVVEEVTSWVAAGGPTGIAVRHQIGVYRMEAYVGAETAPDLVDTVEGLECVDSEPVCQGYRFTNPSSNPDLMLSYGSPDGPDWPDGRLPLASGDSLTVFGYPRLSWQADTDAAGYPQIAGGFEPFFLPDEPWCSVPVTTLDTGMCVEAGAPLRWALAWQQAEAVDRWVLYDGQRPILDGVAPAATVDEWWLTVPREGYYRFVLEVDGRAVGAVTFVACRGPTAPTPVPRTPTPTADPGTEPTTAEPIGDPTSRPKTPTHWTDPAEDSLAATGGPAGLVTGLLAVGVGLALLRRHR